MTMPSSIDVTPRTSSTQQPGFILNPSAGTGSYAYWEDTALSTLAYQWATASPEERQTLFPTWITAQFGTPDVTDGVDANGNVYTSPQTVLALTKFIQSGAAQQDPRITSLLGPPPARGANDYIEDPSQTANRIAQANADRAFALSQNEQARLAADSARDAAIAQQQIAQSGANAAMAARASMYGADQSRAASEFGTRGSVLSSIYGTNEGNRVSALSNAGNLGLGLQGLYDNRTNQALSLRYNPSDLVARELTSRALLKPEGYTGPAFQDNPQLLQAIDRLLNYNPGMTIQQALAALNGSFGGGTGGGGTGGGGAGGGTGGSGTGTGTGWRGRPGGMAGSGPLAGAAMNIPQGMVEVAGPTFEQLGGDPNAGPGPRQAISPLHPNAIGLNAALPPGPILGEGEIPYGNDNIGIPAPAPNPNVQVSTTATNTSGVEPTSRFNTDTIRRAAWAAHGGQALTKAVVGDPQVPGKPNEELVIDRHPEPGFDVIPLNKLSKAYAATLKDVTPHAAWGSYGSWSQTRDTSDPIPYGEDSVATPVSTQPTPTQPAPTTTNTTQPPPAQVTPSSATAPATTTTQPTPTTAPAAPVAPTAPPNVDLTSYADEVYNQLPSYQYLRGDIPLNQWMQAGTNPVTDAFGGSLPDLGGLNLARIAQIMQDPEAFAALGSRYTSANRNLPALISRAAARFGRTAGAAPSLSMIAT